ncbi:MAG: farnesyl diphosphate synthase, partial [Bdellovibrionota bacterium]
EQEITERATFIDEFLERHFDIYRNEYSTVSKTLLDSISYSLSTGGKRFRPILCLMVAEHFSADPMAVLPFAGAVEMIHTYSLIHDDLPCMDDDDFRRGKPTNHKVYGEATALLAGDALLTEAFQVITKFYAPYPALAVDLVSKLASAAGAAGMVGGQILDMQAEKTGANIEQLKTLHKMKTGYLIRVALEGSAIACEASQTDVLSLKFFGENLGLAFQIKDDILDAGEEGQDGRSYVTLLGIEGAQELLEDTSRRAKEFLNKLAKPSVELLKVVEYNLHREK